MATLDEIIETIDDDSYLHDEVQFVIDENLRTITLHKDGVVLGVVGDKNVNRVNFRMPRYYNGFDMSLFSAKVEYITPLGNINFYTVNDLTIDNNNLLFTWLISSDVTEAVGTVEFGIHMTLTNEVETSGTIAQTELVQSFKTTIASAKVLPSIYSDIDSVTTEDSTSVIERILADSIDKINQKFDEVNLIKGPKGDTGEQGIQGEKGDKGDKGDKGEDGETYDDSAIRALIAGKQSIITDLETIRSGAALGATSIQSGVTIYITPQMFGAVGDGVHDDTAALQAAIDYCNRLYRFLPANEMVHSRPNHFPMVKIPSGKYKITDSLLLRTSTYLYGEGRPLLFGDGMDSKTLFKRNESKVLNTGDTEANSTTGEVVKDSAPMHTIIVENIAMMGCSKYFEIDNNGAESSFFDFNKIDVKGGDYFIYGINMDSGILNIHHSMIETVTHLYVGNCDKVNISNNWINMGYFTTHYDGYIRLCDLGQELGKGKTLEGLSELTFTDNICIPNNPLLRKKLVQGENGKTVKIPDPFKGVHDYAWIRVDCPARVYVRRNHCGGECGGATAVIWNAEFTEGGGTSGVPPTVLVVEDSQIQSSPIAYNNVFVTGLPSTGSYPYATYKPEGSYSGDLKHDGFLFDLSDATDTPTSKEPYCGHCGIRLFQLPNILSVKNNYGFNSAEYLVGVKKEYTSQSQLFKIEGSESNGFAHNTAGGMFWTIENNAFRPTIKALVHPYLYQFVNAKYNIRENYTASSTFCSEGVSYEDNAILITIQKPLFDLSEHFAGKLSLGVSTTPGATTVTYSEYLVYCETTYVSSTEKTYSASVTEISRHVGNNNSDSKFADAGIVEVVSFNGASLVLRVKCNSTARLFATFSSDNIFNYCVSHKYFLGL